VWPAQRPARYPTFYGYRGRAAGRNLGAIGEVFKSVRASLSGSVVTWAFSGHARYDTQDHPVYIPRDLDPGRG